MQERREEKTLREKAKKSKKAKRWKKDEQDDYRTKYQRDIGRILFSNPFRRLRLKTQVFMADGLEQHNRTRLTHSIEVAQMAKSIAKPLRLNEDLTEAIALGHDLGHTPFGHAGEEALDECLQVRNAGTFNHNAQSVWLVRRTFAGRTDAEGNHYPGLNLTYDVVEGIWKHTDVNESIDEFESLKHYNPEDERGFLEAQIVNVADGITYIKHDIEDGIREELITYEQVEEVWNDCLDIPFDKNYWIHHFISDLIENNEETEEINFSSEYKKAFKEMKEFIKENIIKSEKVKKNDQEAKIKVKKIFNYCIKNPDYLIEKCPEINKPKIDEFGIERATVDFIQWCGDELANKIFESIT